VSGNLALDLTAFLSTLNRRHLRGGLTLKPTGHPNAPTLAPPSLRARTAAVDAGGSAEPLWMQLLASVAPLAPSSGAAIHARVHAALQAHPAPPPAVAAQLLWSLQPEMYRPLDAVATKTVALTALALHRAALAEAKVETGAAGGGSSPRCGGDGCSGGVATKGLRSPRRSVGSPLGRQLKAGPLQQSPVSPLEAQAHLSGGWQGQHQVGQQQQQQPLGATWPPAWAPNQHGASPQPSEGGGCERARMQRSPFPPLPAPSAPPFWPSAMARVDGRCPSEAGGWPGGSAECAGQFARALGRFYAARRQAQPPSGDEVDACGLYREVCLRGGAQAVTQVGAWGAVAAGLRLPATQCGAASALRGHHAALLGAYEHERFVAAFVPEGLALHAAFLRATAPPASIPRGGSTASLNGGEADCAQEGRGFSGGVSPRGGASDSACVTSGGRRAQGGHASGSRFTESEDAVILAARRVHGNRWSAMETLLPGRSSASIKKHWHSTLKFKDAARTAAVALLPNRSGPGVSTGGCGVPPFFGGSMHVPGGSSGGSPCDGLMLPPCPAEHALTQQLGYTALDGPARPFSAGGALPRQFRLSCNGSSSALRSASPPLHQPGTHAQQQQQQQYMHNMYSADQAGDWIAAQGGVAPGQQEGADAGIPLMPRPLPPAAYAQALRQQAHYTELSSVQQLERALAVAASAGQLPPGMQLTVGPSGRLVPSGGWNTTPGYPPSHPVTWMQQQQGGSAAAAFAAAMTPAGQAHPNNHQQF